MKTMELYGKVLRIFDETSLLVNIGKKDGLKRGDRLAVIEKGEEVKDPDSGESLGALEYIKAELVAADVQERLSILRTESPLTDSMDIPLSARMVRDSIKSDGTQDKMHIVRGEISGVPALSPVKKGDPVRLVI